MFCHCSVAKSCPTLCNPMHCSTPGLLVFAQVCPSSCVLNQWCHPTISSSVTLFSFCLQSFSESINVFSSELALPIRWPKYWSFSLCISPSVSIQGWFPLGLTGLISLMSKGLWKQKLVNMVETKFLRLFGERESTVKHMELEVKWTC